MYPQIFAIFRGIRHWYDVKTDMATVVVSASDR